MAGNKSDLYEYEEITKEEGIAFANQHNAIFQLTSAKESNETIDLLFENIGKLFLNSNLENINNLTKKELKIRVYKSKDGKNHGQNSCGSC